MNAQKQPLMTPVRSGDDNVKILVAQIESLLAQLKAAVEEKEVDLICEKPMTAKQAMEWMGVSRGKFFKMVNENLIKQHCAQHGSPMYFKSEIIAAIKAC